LKIDLININHQQELDKIILLKENLQMSSEDQLVLIFKLNCQIELMEGVTQNDKTEIDRIFNLNKSLDNDIKTLNDHIFDSNQKINSLKNIKSE